MACHSPRRSARELRLREPAQAPDTIFDTFVPKNSRESKRLGSSSRSIKPPAGRLTFVLCGRLDDALKSRAGQGVGRSVADIKYVEINSRSSTIEGVGTSIPPFNAWLVMRGSVTLSLRLPKGRARGTRTRFREYGHLRLSIGLKDPNDLIADISATLKETLWLIVDSLMCGARGPSLERRALERWRMSLEETISHRVPLFLQDICNAKCALSHLGPCRCATRCSIVDLRQCVQTKQ